MATGADPLQKAISLHKAGDLAQAEQLYRQILASNPRHPDAWHLLGLVAQGRGQHDSAIEPISRAIDIRPDAPAYHNSLGEAYRALGRFDEARACYERVLQLEASSIPAHYNLGLVFAAEKQWARAADYFARAASLNPRFAAAHRNRAQALWAVGDVEAAAASYAEAVRQPPEDLEALLGYARLLESQGRGAEALEMAERAVRVEPDAAAAHFIRGKALELLSRKSAATAAFHETLRCEPDFVDAYVHLASQCNERSDADGAIEYCRKGLAADPDNAKLHNMLGIALHAQGRGVEAVASSRRAVELRPDNAGAHSNLLYTLNFLDNQDPAALYDEHLQWARRHAEPLTADASSLENDRTPDRRLRVGYVSPDFRQHAVNYFVEPILLAHDHRQLEIFCYSSVTKPDAVTERLRAAADHWRDARAKTDEQLAAIIRDDKIDILVDLSGHMGHPRLLVFARKPAPIQVTYIGYQNTTGMSAMDYRLTDERADPPGVTEAFYTERLERLPRAFFCYKPSDAPKVSALPALSGGGVTFGSFNNFMKVTPRVVDAWLEILARVPNSRLSVVACPPGSTEARLRERAEEKGLDPGRIEFHPRCPRPEYLRLIQQADIALDPFPFNGHTTTCDAVWMGVPVVMLEGATYCSRFGGCVLAPLGLEHLIARSIDEYVTIAARTAADLDGLAQLRRELRGRMARSALLDFDGFTRNLEDAYRRMWTEWCQR